MVASAKTAVVMLSIGSVVHAWDGSVTLYDDANFQGFALQLNFSTSQRCFNVGCFDNRTSSLTWEGLPTKGSFGSEGISYVVVYDHKNCEGGWWRWSTRNKIFPDNLFGQFNDRISSFMIWEHSGVAMQGNFDFDVCPFESRSIVAGREGNDSLTVVSEREMTRTVVETALKEATATPTNARPMATVGTPSY